MLFAQNTLFKTLKYLHVKRVRHQWGFDNILLSKSFYEKIFTCFKGIQKGGIIYLDIFKNFILPLLVYL